MPTVTGLTADRMLAIEAACIVEGAVLLDNLILTKHDGTTINAGGVRGPKGDVGDEGPKGETGPTGPKGDTGNAGPIGPQGNVGPAGATGPQGVKGDTGDSGPAGTAATITGATATGLAAGATPTVTAGGTSSARSFAFGIPAGTTGPAGAAGPTGPKGDTGATGPAGAAGPTGPAGAAATITGATATGLVAGATPTVTAGGTETARSFAFGIPAGATGPQGPPGADADVSMIIENGPSYQPGWAAWDDSVYRNLRFFLHADGWVSVSGLTKYVGGTGAALYICSLSGNYVPRDGLRDQIPVNVNDSTTPRWVNIQNSGIYLRGALPAVNQFVAFCGLYPGVLAVV